MIWDYFGFDFWSRRALLVWVFSGFLKEIEERVLVLIYLSKLRG